jgi:hypothetical protein
MATIEVVPFSGGSAKLGVYTLEHCPPHATCRDVARQWVVRLTFTFVDRTIGLLSIHPPQNSPGLRVINELASAVLQNLPECRRLWWTYQQNNPLIQAQGALCLNNTTFQGGTIVEASYDPGSCQTRMRFRDGTIVTRTV